MNIQGDLQGVAAVVPNQEVQGRDVHRDGDVAVVGIDGRQRVRLLHVLGRRSASE